MPSLCSGVFYTPTLTEFVLTVNSQVWTSELQREQSKNPWYQLRTSSKQEYGRRCTEVMRVNAAVSEQVHC